MKYFQDSFPDFSTTHRSSTWIAIIPRPLAWAGMGWAFGPQESRL